MDACIIQEFTPDSSTEEKQHAGSLDCANSMSRGYTLKRCSYKEVTSVRKPSRFNLLIAIFYW